MICSLLAIGTVTPIAEAQRVKVFGNAPEPARTLAESANGVAAVAAGANHVLILKLDGSVLSSAAVPSDLPPLTAIAAGSSHSIGLATNGAVRCWGDNTQGQCNVPAGLPSVSTVAGGGAHTLACQTSGLVICWGSNWSGQCTPPVGLSSVTRVAAGEYHSVALRSDGTVACWGDNSGGQCTVPADVVGVREVGAGHFHTLALLTDGSVRAWGWSGDGQTTVPPSLPPVASIDGGSTFSVARTSGGGIRVWGLFTGTQVPSWFDGVTQISGKSGWLAAVVACSDSPLDCDADGVSDACEYLDCNANLLADGCEIVADPVLDENEDGILDACQNFIFVRPGDSIQAAIDAAPVGATIEVLRGTYAGNLDLKGKAITLRAPFGPSETTIAGSSSGPAVRCSTAETSATKVIGFKITGGGGHAAGVDRMGGGIYVSAASPSISECTIEGNSVVSATGIARGGGIYVASGNPSFTDCIVIANTAEFGGAISIQGGAPILDTCMIVGNTAEYGGAIDVGSVPTTAAYVRGFGLHFESNIASVEGGAIRIAGKGFLTIDGVRFESNFAGDGSAGAWVFTSATSECGFRLADASVCGAHRFDGGFVDGGANALFHDCNADGFCDADQIAANPELDIDLNGTIDVCEDCDGDGVPDGTEIASGARDCNGNWVPDSCEISSGAASDTDGDGVLDSCEGTVLGSMQRISAPRPSIVGEPLRFGRSLSAHGSEAVASVGGFDTDSVTDVGGAFILSRAASGEWMIVQRLPSSETLPLLRVADQDIGSPQGVSIGPDRIVMGAPFAPRAIESQSAFRPRSGEVHAFRRNSAGVWKAERTFDLGTAQCSEGRFGSQVAYLSEHSTEWQATLFASNPRRCGSVGLIEAFYEFGGLWDRSFFSPSWIDSSWIPATANSAQISIALSSKNELGSSLTYLATTPRYHRFVRSVVGSGNTWIYTSAQSTGGAVAAFDDDILEARVGDGYATVSGGQDNTVFVRQVLRPWQTSTQDEFGFAVALSSDLIAIGAPNFAPSGGTARGAVFVYRRTGLNFWVPLQLLLPPTTEVQRFGESIAIVGSQVLVGAPGSDPEGRTDEGLVFVCNLPDCDNDGIADAFEIRDGARDCDGDQIPDACAIASGAVIDSDANGVPDACEFTERSSIYQIVSASRFDVDSATRMVIDGPTVSLPMDTWDSRETGASGSDHGALAILEQRSDGSHQQVAVLTVPWATDEDSLAIGYPGDETWSGATDIEDDRLIVGNRTDAINGNAAQGSALIFERNATGAWQPVALLQGAIGANQRFGESVALSGNRAFVADRTGRIFVYEVDARGIWILKQTISGYTTGALRIKATDAGTRLYVGDAWANTDRGQVKVLQINATTNSLLTTLTASDGASNERFGYHLAVEGSTLVVGAPLDDGKGAAYVYNTASLTTAPTKLVPPSLVAGDQFGWSFDVVGSVLEIGAPGRDLGPTLNVGSIFRYRKLGTAWTLAKEDLRGNTANLGTGRRVLVSFQGFGVSRNGSATLLSVPVDSDLDNTADVVEICTGLLADCNYTLAAAVSDIAYAYSTDLNQNGIPDDCLASETVVGGTGHATIQAAIDVAANGATVLVAPGTYPPFSFNGKQVTVRSIGGPSQTTIAGTGLGAVVRCNTSESASSVLEGFTIRGGGGYASGTALYGGGMYIEGASPTVRNCVIRENAVTAGTGLGRGGGVYVMNGAPLFENCVIESNAAKEGGGVWIEALSTPKAPVFRSTVIASNSSAGRGGGVALAGEGRPYFDGCDIRANTASGTGRGGAISTPDAASANSYAMPTLLSTAICLNVPDAMTGPTEDMGGNRVSGDCNGNTICDADEIEQNLSLDLDSNGVLDTCEDADLDGVPNGLEIRLGAVDCDGNGIPDISDIAANGTLDANGNGYLDACELTVEPNGWLSTTGAGANIAQLGATLDGTTGVLVAAAPTSDTAGLSGASPTQVDAGALVVLERGTNGLWRQTALLRLQRAAPFDQLGSAMPSNAIAVTPTRIVVGCRGDDHGAVEDCGSIAIFDKNEHGSWVEQPSIRLSVPIASRELGHSVALSGQRVVSMTTDGVLYIFSQDVNGVWSNVTVSGMGSEYASLSANADWIAVGLPFDDTDGLADSGAVKFIKRATSGTSWSLIATRRATTPAAGDNVGFDVLMRENGLNSDGWMVLTAPGRDCDGLVDRGAWSFASSNSSLITLDDWGVPDHAAGDRVGRQLAQTNDVSDPLHQAVMALGSPFDDTSGSDDGSLTLLSRAFNYYLEPRTKLRPSVAQAGSQFGGGLAFAGTTLACAAPSWTISGASARGKVFLAVPLDTDCNDDGRLDLAEAYDERIRDRNRNDQLDACEIMIDPTLDVNANGVLDSCEASSDDEVVLRAGSGAGAAQLGGSLAVGDSGKRLVIGLRGATLDGLSNRGAVQIWERQIDLSWNLVAVLGQPDGMSGDGFGASVDTYSGSVFIGAPTDDVTAVDTGSAWIFNRYGSGSRYQYESWDLRVIPTTVVAGANFGASVLVTSTGVFVAGAPVEGAIYRFNSNGTATSTNHRIEAPNDLTSRFGSVMCRGYVGEYFVGAPLADINGFADAGAVYRYASSGVLSQTLTAPQGASGDNFGQAIALNSDSNGGPSSTGALVIGAPGVDRLVLNGGACYVWERCSSAWQYLWEIVPGELLPNDGFGSSVAARGASTCASAGNARLFACWVGAPRRDNGGLTDVGAVFVLAPTLQPPTGFNGMFVHDILYAANPGSGNMYGSSVALIDETVAIGSPLADVGGVIDSGAVSLYRYDCDADGLNDIYDTLVFANSATGTSGAIDCNANLVPDSCEISSGTSTDLNGNGIPDECDDDVVGGSGSQSIQAAVQRAIPGGVIKVYPGTYLGPVDFAGKAITIRGMGASPSDVRIEGPSTTSVVAFRTGETANAVLENVTIAGGGGSLVGLGRLGGGILIQGASPTIRDCIVTDNHVGSLGGRGGGLAIVSGNPHLERVTIQSNSAADGGGIYMSTAGTAPHFPSLIDCVILENSASGSGGGIMLEGASVPTLEGLRVSGNTASPQLGSGGGMRVLTMEDAAPILIESVFCFNEPDEVVGVFTDGGGNSVSGDCNSNGICDADEIADGAVGDCDQNGIPDSCEPVVVRSSPTVSPFWSAAPFVFQRMQLAPAASDVRITVRARSDLSALDEFVTVKVNGIPVGRLFEATGTDCVVAGDQETLVLSAAQFNALLENGAAELRLEPSAAVSNYCAGGTWVQVSIQYIGVNPDCDEDGILDLCEIAADPKSVDCNGNGVLDSCDIAGGTETDVNSNGVPDDCEGGCDVDVDGDGACTLIDCNDADSTIYPNAPELCATIGTDNDCDGDTQDATDPRTFYLDSDSDGFGDPAVTTQACVAPPGYVSNANDGCPSDGTKSAQGICGCGIPDVDADGDGVIDCLEFTPAEWAVSGGGNGHWYAVVVGVMTLEEATTFASARGAHLATITNQDEQVFIAGLPKMELLGCAGPRIGLVQASGASLPSDGWAWQTGEALTFVRWADGEPDDDGGVNETSAALGCAAERQWHDVPALTRLSFVLEWSSDCDADGVIDFGELVAGTESDVNSNGVPDDCEVIYDVPTIFPTVQAAIDAVPVGVSRVITVAPGIYFESFSLNGKNVVIRGATEGPTIFDGTGLSTSIVTMIGGEPPTAGIERMVFRKGRSGQPINPPFFNLTGGGAVFGRGSSAFVRHCAFEENLADFGGAIYLLDCDVSISNASFEANIAREEGGAILTYRCTGVISDCLFGANRCGGELGGSGAAFKAVGALEAGESIVLQQCTVTENDAGLGGAAIEFYQSLEDRPGVLRLMDCTVTQNRSGGTQPLAAGGLKVIGNLGCCVLSAGTEICDNEATNVDGPYLIQDLATVCDCDADIVKDGIVDAADLGILLSLWGTAPSDGRGDIDHDGIVGAADLSRMLVSWGPCENPS